MEPKVEQVTINYLTLGEGPHWDEDNHSLYYVDIFGKSILRYDPVKRRETKGKVGGQVGFIVPIAGRKDHFVVGLDLKFVIIKWDGLSEETEEVETLGIADLGDRLNDGKADPNGRLFGGTMGKEDPPGKFELKTSALYTIDKNGPRVVAKPITLSNGLAWNLQKNTMYYIDTPDNAVHAYDYNFSTGDIDNKRVVIDFVKNGIRGVPDGMTIDTDGNLWIACFGANQVIKVDPEQGKVLQTVSIPAAQVTSVAFGGENLDELYVTTASMTIKEEQLPPCGALFVIKNLGVRGYPGVSCKL